MKNQSLCYSYRSRWDTVRVLQNSIQDREALHLWSVIFTSGTAPIGYTMHWATATFHVALQDANYFDNVPYALKIIISHLVVIQCRRKGNILILIKSDYKQKNTFAASYLIVKCWKLSLRFLARPLPEILVSEKTDTEKEKKSYKNVTERNNLTRSRWNTCLGKKIKWNHGYFKIENFRFSKFARYKINMIY